MRIQRLGLRYVRDYRALMLRAYADAPEAFTATVPERESLPLEWWHSRVSEESGSPERVYGAFVGDQLAGVAGLRLARRPKTRHQATLYGMYVLAEHRSRGLGRALVEAVLEAARAEPGICMVKLTVTEMNTGARRLYEACGFRAFGTEPMAIRVDDRFLAKVHMWHRLGSTEPTLRIEGESSSRDSKIHLRRRKPKEIKPMSIEQYLESLARQALVASELEADGPSVLSCQGGSPLCHDGEAWPEHEGKPLMSLLNIAARELPFVPDFLDGTEYFSLFIVEGDWSHGIRDGSLVVRRYPQVPEAALEGGPEGEPRLALAFREVVDYPHPDVIESLLADRPELVAEYDERRDELEEAYPCHTGVKLGGYPYLVQETAFLIEEDPDHEIQIDGTSYYSYADSGIGYVDKGMRSIHWETL